MSVVDRPRTRTDGRPRTVEALTIPLDVPRPRSHTERISSRPVRRRGWLVRRALLAADILGLCFAFLLAEYLLPPGHSDSLSAQVEHLIFLASLPVWVVVAKLYGLYDNDEERTDHSTVDDLVPVFHLVSTGAWILFAFTTLSGLAQPQLPRLMLFWGLAVVFLTVGRAAARAYCRRQVVYLQNTVIVGAGDVGQLVAHKFLQHPEYGINLVGFVDSTPRPPRADVDHIALLGPPDRLPELIDLLDIERVVVAFSSEHHEEVLDLVRRVKDLDVQIDIVPRLFELVGPGVRVHTVEGLPLFGLPRLSLSRSSLFLKRCFDVTLAGLGLVALAPFFALIALRIRLDSPGPVFFRQVRMGKSDKTFEIFKFRTMSADAEARKQELAHLNTHAGGDARMFKAADDPRITRFGGFLRRYSIDELPQLLNVVRGEMSLVGPRPLILDEDRYVVEWARDRLKLKPGMTGPWQVLGASDIPFGEMVGLDYLYVTSWSVFNDLKLVLQTVPALLRPRGAH